MRPSQPRWIRRNSNDRVESSATFATKEETAQFSRQSRYSILFETKVEVARLRKRHKRKNQRRNRPVRRVKNLLISNFHERVGDGAIFATKAETAQPRNNYSWRSRTRWRRCDFRDQGSDGTTSTTKAEKTRLSRSRQRRRSFPNQGRNGAVQTRKRFFLAIDVEKTILLRPRCRRRDTKFSFQSLRPRRIRRDCRNQGGGSVTFALKAKMAQPRKWISFDFSDQTGKGKIFATRAETAQPRNNYSWRSRTRWDGATFATKVATAQLPLPKRSLSLNDLIDPQKTAKSKKKCSHAACTTKLNRKGLGMLLKKHLDWNKKISSIDER